MNIPIHYICNNHIFCLPYMAVHQHSPIIINDQHLIEFTHHYHFYASCWNGIREFCVHRCCTGAKELKPT